MKQSTQMIKGISMHCKKFTLLICFITIVLNYHCDSQQTNSWPTYRYDNARSGITKADIKLPLSLYMTIQPKHVPKPAWPEPGEERARMHADNVYHVTAARGKIFYGSSVDNKVYALNMKSGETEWTFFTDGPVRFAPTIWKNRVFVGSDDGHVYCLQINNGKLVWKYRPGPSDEKILGNGRMISLWPIRTNILVEEGVVYFGAGVFPYEGIYICGLNAHDGTVVWKNDTIGDRAHELAYGGISPQSYLTASENALYVPSGRAMPAAFDIQNGEFLYYCLPGGKIGGTWVLLNEDNLISGVDYSGVPAKAAYDKQSGKKIDDVHAWFPGIELIIMSDVSYTLTENEIFALDRAQFQSAMEKMTGVKDKIKTLNSGLRDIRRKSRDASKTTLDQLNQQRDDLSQKMSELNEQETQLKNSVLKWRYAVNNMNSLICAGDLLFAAGDKSIVAVDARDGSELWREQIEGKACGIAAVNGNLFVSSDNGNIYCFGEKEVKEARMITSAVNSSPYKEDELTNIYVSAAEEIVNKTGVKKGYCLILGCGTGRLAFEIAKRTELKIIGIEEDATKVQIAKEKLDIAAKYGSQVIIEQWDIASLPDYFANLIICDEMLVSGNIPESSEHIFRVLKPYGGIAYFGQPEESANRDKSLQLENLLSWMRESGLPDPEIKKENGIWVGLRRDALPGAGSWTEQYGNAQNTASSSDQLVKGPLGTLWYGEPGSEKMVERHAKAASPVSIKGRMFIQGEEIIMAYDTYNGSHLWERKIAGAVRARSDVDGGNLKATQDALYVAAHEKCYRLNPATGETMHVFKIPPAPGGKLRRWGYISFANDILYGSRALPLKRDFLTVYNNLVKDGKWKNIDEIPPELHEIYEKLKTYPDPDEKMLWDMKRSGLLWRSMTDYPVWEIYQPSIGAVTEKMMVSDLIFALNPQTGNVLWRSPGKRIAHITITNGDGKLFFAEAATTSSQNNQAIREKQKLIKSGRYKQSNEGKIPYSDSDVRMIVALNAVTGTKLWQRPIDLTGCGGDGMAAAYQDGVLLFFASSGTHDAWRFKEGTLKWRRLTAISAKDGEVLWSHPINYNARPVIVGNQVFIEPRACDLYTGEIKKRFHPISGKQVPWEYLRPGHTCAITSASANMLFYRSSSTAIYDFEQDRGLTLYGGIRPGCWINMVPASGVLLFPEASAGCTCSFPLRCSVVLKHKENRPQPWNVFITHGPITSVKHFCINLGAPADMKDDQGNVWFGYPNPKTDYLQIHYPNYGVKFSLNDEIIPGMGYFSSDFKGKAIDGTQKPWLFASGCLGLQKYEIPLIDDIWGEKSGIYSLRLGFSAPKGDRAGQRVFDVLVQGDPVLKNFDIMQEAGAANKAVIKELREIKVDNFLELEFIAKNEDPDMSEAPLVNFIELTRDDLESIKTAKLPEPITVNAAKVMLRTAESAMEKKEYETALEKYHTVLDAAPSKDLKLLALEGLETIKSSKSLGGLAKYCRDDDPILWNYQGPDQDLQNSAFKVFIAIANEIAQSDKAKAARMLKYALKVQDETLHKQVVGNLKELGFVIEDEKI